MIIDVRNPSEYYGVEGHITNSINIPMKQIIRDPNKLREYSDKVVVLVCSIGRRSRITTRYLKFHGYLNIKNLSGGITKWANEGYPLILKTQDS